MLPNTYNIMDFKINWVHLRETESEQPEADKLNRSGLTNINSF